MTLTSIAILLLFLSGLGAAASEVVNIPLNNQDSINASGVNGPWPTIPILYATDKSLDCHLTFWNQSIFSARQPCVDTLPSNRSEGAFLCSDDLVYPPAFDLSAVNESAITFMNLSSASIFYAITEDSLLVHALDAHGYGYQATSDISLGSQEFELEHLVSINFTSTTTSSARRLPLMDSFISAQQIAASLVDKGDAASPFLSLHLGSQDPNVPGSLQIGGFDNSRIVGDMMRILADNSLQITITDINIGVEEGFLPLQSLKFANGSFPQGPYKVDPRFRLHKLPSYVQPIVLEPGLPYLYFPKDICDPLAEILDATYDQERNLYFWNKPDDDPIFKSPTFLEIELTGYDSTEGYISPTELIPTVSVKIPLALLQHKFSATVQAENGTMLRPARYLPCSPQDESVLREEWQNTLGRAFFQAAFIGTEFPSDTPYQLPTYWIAQAPGPTNLAPPNISVIDSGYISNRSNVTVEPRFWTNSWSAVLPLWTMDADGKTTLEQRNNQPSDNHFELTRGQVVGIAVGATVASVVAVSITCCFGLRVLKKSRHRRSIIRKQIEEEDRIARELEMESIEKEKSEQQQPRYRDSPPEAPLPGSSGNNTATSQVVNDDPVDACLPLMEDDSSVRSNESIPLTALRRHEIGPDLAHGFRWSVQ